MFCLVRSPADFFERLRSLSANVQFSLEYSISDKTAVANAKRDPHLKSQREKEDVMHRRAVERRPKERKMVDPSQQVYIGEGVKEEDEPRAA